MDEKQRKRLERAITPEGCGSARSYTPPQHDFRPPRWSKWRLMPTVKKWEAVALSLNIEPEKIKTDHNAWMGAAHPFVEDDEFNDRLTILNKHASSQTHFPTPCIGKMVNWYQCEVRLDEFAAWCIHVCFEIPPELAALAKAATQTAPKVEIPPAAEGGERHCDKEDKEYWAEKAKFRDQNEEAKAKAGRYQLAEAAQFIADNSTENVDSMMLMLFKEARDGRLTVYEPGRDVPYQFSAIENLSIEAWLEAYWDDLNTWLEIKVPRLECKFPKPDATAAKGEAVRGITKSAVINAFQGLYFDLDKWKKYLGDPPDWLKECRVAKGNKTTSATWNPVLIAAALIDKGITRKKLDAVFVRLPGWADEWRNVSESLPD